MAAWTSGGGAPSRAERVAPRTPQLVTDPLTLEAIFRLRAQVWRETGDVSPSALRGGRWSDEHDSAAMHWVVRDDTGALLAAEWKKIASSSAGTSAWPIPPSIEWNGQIVRLYFPSASSARV